MFLNKKKQNVNNIIYTKVIMLYMLLAAKVSSLKVFAADLNKPNIVINKTNNGVVKTQVVHNGRQVNTSNGFNTVLSSYQGWVYLIIGMAVLTLNVLFIRYFLELARDGNSAQGRAAAYQGLVTTFIASGLTGAAIMLVGMFFSMWG